MNEATKEEVEVNDLLSLINESMKKWGDEKAYEWISSPHPQLNGRTPREAAFCGEGQQALHLLRTAD